MISGEESLRAVTRGVFGVIGLEIEGGPCLDGVFGVGLVELVFLVVFEALEGCAIQIHTTASNNNETLLLCSMLKLPTVSVNSGKA